MTSNQNVRQYCLPLVSSLALSFDTDPLSAMILDSGASSGKLLAFGTRAVNETFMKTLCRKDNQSVIKLYRQAYNFTSTHKARNISKEASETRAIVTGIISMFHIIYAANLSI